MTEAKQDDSNKSPRAFISYAWSGPTHESWVVNLATRLREDGVDVVLDKWDLKPGHDAYHFMEQMVRDKTVKKVIMVCDKQYTEKANDREGGVGVESQIISPEVYASAAQDKYAAVITENDSEGKAYVPTFYKGRIYLDFTSDENYEREYEGLLRWVLDKPLHVKPKLGEIPSHIAQPTPLAAATASSARRAEEAIRQHSPSGRAFTREFVERFVAELREAGTLRGEDGVWDEQVLASVKRMRPYLHQFQDLTRVVSRFSEGTDLFEELLTGIETLGTLMFRPPNVMSWSEHSFDHYRLSIWEMFLTTFAILLKERRFDLANAAVAKPYLIPNRDASEKATSNFAVFLNPIPTLRQRNDRLGGNRSAAAEADVLAEQYKSGSISMTDIMQADFILYIRSLSVSSDWRRWYPFTLVFADNHRPFELFARAESRAYFSQLAPLLCVKTADDLKTLLAGVMERNELKIGYWPVEVMRLANAENLASVS